MGDFSFPKHFHLRRPPEFSTVYSRGRKKYSKGFILFRHPNQTDHPRLGLSVSRRFGKAVRRNRMKRFIREAIRLNWREWHLEGSDIVVVVKKGSTDYGLSEVTHELSNVFLRKSRKVERR